MIAVGFSFSSFHHLSRENQHYRKKVKDLDKTPVRQPLSFNVLLWHLNN